MSSNSCDYCLNNEYDEELDDYVCSVEMDMDDMERFSYSQNRECPFFRINNEYKIVERQN
ncbi:MAG: DUF6472 family protein [Clostridia bacterium]|nr:DUF6472 family protein [Clostridia bacterium]